MARGAPKVKPVEVGKKLRDANQWFEEGCKKVKEAAIDKKRAELHAKGPELKSKEVRAVADELERIQRELNPLEERHRELSEQLLAHWAHTGIEEIEGELGKMLVSVSFKIAVSPEVVERGLGEQYRKVQERRLNPTLLLALAGNDQDVQQLAIRAARALVSVKITPPSSRRPRSGQTDAEEDEE